MKTLNFFTKAMLFSLPILVLTACTTVSPTTTSYDSLAQEIQQVREQMKESPVFERVNKVYSEEVVVPVFEQHQWLSNEFKINLKNASFSNIAYVLSTKSDNKMFVKYQPNMNMDMKISMEYEGDLYGAYEYLKSKTGFQYDFSDRFVSWSETVTREIRIKATIGQNSMRMGVSDEKEEQEQNSFGSGGRNASSQISKETKTDEFTMKTIADSDPIRDIETAILPLLSAKGNYSLSRATNTLIVTDKVANVDQIESTVNKFNEILTTQVLLTVRLVEVSLFEEHKYGVNWNLIQESADGTGALSLSTAFGALGGTGGNGTSSLSYQVFDTANDRFAGSNAILDALKQQGNVSLVQHPDVMTLSNRVARFESTDFRTFLESSAVLTTADVGSTSELMTGVLNDGFVMSVLPNIVDEEVMFDLSILFTSVDPIIGQIESNGSVVSTPNGSTRKMVQQGVIRNGHTLVLTGYRESVENKTEEGFGFIPQSIGERSSTKELLLIITPTIVRL